jgi:plastocyanin
VRTAIRATVACVIVLAGATPAPAATRTVSMVDFDFSPRTQRVAQGDTVRWQNSGVRTHTATQDAPLALFNTGSVAAGATSAGTVLVAAGAYPYHCAIHPSMVGSIKVPVKVAPLSGTTATTFTVTVAAQAAPSGFVYDVQRRIGTGSWTAWRTGIATASVTFRATTAGQYSFRAMLRRLSTGAKSRPSPAKTVTVG